MKNSRRKFIQTSATLAAVGKALAAPTHRVTKPIAVSTWNFGVGANAEAWKILSPCVALIT